MNHEPIEISLFAPTIRRCEVCGNWNDFEPQPMSLGDDGYWRTTVNLADGEYRYFFRLQSNSWFNDGRTVDVADPCADHIDPYHEPQAKLFVRNGHRRDVNYDWKHDDVPLPPNHELIIYELHVGDFVGSDESAKSKFERVAEKLDYLKDLGINAIELMPVKEFPGDSWGYNLKSLYAVENSYGTPEQLCQLIDEAHARGMRVICDGVYNHAHKDHPFAHIDYEYWFHRKNPDPPEADWGPKFNYGQWDERHGVFPARKYVKEAIRHWIETYHIDGIRFDATRMIANFDMLREMSGIGTEAVGRLKHFITIAEHIPEDPAIVGYPEKGPMHAAWHDAMCKQLQAVVVGVDRDGLQPWDLRTLMKMLNPRTNHYGSAGRFVNYVDNHDQPHLMNQLGDWAKTFDDAAIRRSILAAGILMISPGMPMLWMGQEFGSAARKQLEPSPLDWSLLNNDRNRHALAMYRKLIWIRREHHWLAGDEFEPLLADNDRHLLAFKRWNDNGSVIVFVANTRDEESPGFAIERGVKAGRWTELLSGESFELKQDKLELTLRPSEIRVYRRDGDL